MWQDCFQKIQGKAKVREEVRADTAWSQLPSEPQISAPATHTATAILREM